MKKIVIIILLFINIYFYGVNFVDLDDKTVMAKVGSYEITAGDMKSFMLGYSSVDRWLGPGVNRILDIMIENLLFLNGCDEQKISVTQIEVEYYLDQFFREKSINKNDLVAIQLYFDQNDPYADIHDFFRKSFLHLSKIKYLSANGYLNASKSYCIFFWTKGLDKNKKDSLRTRVIQLTRDIADGGPYFFEMVEKFSEDANTKKNRGDIGVVNMEKKSIDMFGRAGVERIIKAGLFNPIFVETNSSFNIVMNYDYVIPYNPELENEVNTKLREKFKVAKYFKQSVEEGPSEK
jgi:hypothetical protein